MTVECCKNCWWFSEDRSNYCIVKDIYISFPDVYNECDRWSSKN